MAVTDGARITLSVDDAGAEYPVLIDPFVQQPSTLAPSSQTGARFGFSVAYMEKFTGGTAQQPNAEEGALVVGAPYFDAGLTDQGRVFAFRHTVDGFNMKFFQAKGTMANENFGYSVAVAQPYDLPDTDGTRIKTFKDDFIADLVVGAPGYNSGNGRVYVFYGIANASTPLGPDDPTSGYWAATAVGNLGWSVAVGDVSGDRIQDLVAGRPSYFAGGIEFYKSTSTGLPATATASFSAAVTAGDQFGWSVAFAGDVNHIADGDGKFRGDVLVGAPGYNGGRGKVYLFNGTSTATGISTSPYWTAESTQAGAKFGYAIAGNSNIDGNNNKDFVVGAPYYDGNAADGGRVYVYRSNSSGNPMTATSLESPQAQAGCRFGYSVCLGNVDKAGPSDVIVGVPWWDISPSDDKGVVFLYYGVTGSSPNALQPETIYSPQLAPANGEHFGSSLAYIFKISDPADPACIAAGAPEAKPGNVTNAGMVGVFQYGTLP